MVELAANIWADGPPTMPSQPYKPDIRAWGTWVESLINAFTSNGGVLYTSLSSLSGDLAPAANRSAWVLGDPIADNNGIYVKTGNPGSGFWTRVGDLPFSFIIANDAGAGTPNAIQATSALPVSGSALVWLSLSKTTTASPLTVSFNGGSPLTVKTNSGNNPSPGSLTAGMIVLGIRAGSTFRLVSDQASAAIIASAEAAALRAENAATLALNNFLSDNFVSDGVATDFQLSANPGSTNNMIVLIDGLLPQMPDTYALVYVGATAYIRLSEVLPTGVKINVRYGNVIAVGTPTDGSITAPKLSTGAVTTAKLLDANVTTAKLTDNAITYAKMQDISAALRLLGGIVSGDPVEITPAQLRDNFLPAGSVVDSAVAINASGSPAISAVIPLDNTIPQITEGTQIITMNFTPKSTTNKLRISVAGFWSNSLGPATNIWAIFNGGANAIRAAPGYIPATDALMPFEGRVEYTPGTTAVQTISLNLGKAGGSGFVIFDSVAANALFGGVAAVVLTVEEIKA